jgi:hypothetical protein
MLADLTHAWFRWLGGSPCFRVHAKGRRENTWRVVDVFASHRRDMDSRWPPPWRGTCIAWGARVIAVGWDFAEEVLREQAVRPASRERPVEVVGGRLRADEPRPVVLSDGVLTASQILAHECGHTAQAVRLGCLYWPVGAAFTCWGEGRRWWNWFENQASEEGQLGGIVNGSVCPQLIASLSGQ